MTSIKVQLFFLAYRLILMPTALGLAMTVGLLNSKIRLGLKLRLRLRQQRRKFNAQPIWIHASSGEFEYAKPLIRELKSRHPHIPILVTYYSPSYQQRIAEYPGVDQSEPLPLDLPGPIQDFLNFYRPRAAIFSRTDLWPELLLQTKLKNIPSLLFSCTRPPFSGFHRIFKRFYGMLYDFIGEIHCVSEADRAEISALTTTPISVSGDTRYDQVSFRLQQAHTLSEDFISASAKGPPLLIAGSTWPEDDKILLPAVSGGLIEGSLRLILAPHEISTDHLKDIQQQLSRNGISVTRFTTGDWNGRDVLLIDQIGILADLYSYCDFAFIGGSFRKKVHSVMEALGAGLPVAVGPYHRNNREAIEFQTENACSRQAVTVVENESSLSDWVMSMSARTPESRQQMNMQIKTLFEKRQGATLRLVARLEILYKDV